MADTTLEHERTSSATGGDQTAQQAADTSAPSADVEAASAQSAEVGAAPSQPALTPEQQRALIDEKIRAGNTSAAAIADDVFYATWPHMAPDGQRQPLPSRDTATPEQQALIDSYLDIYRTSQSAVEQHREGEAREEAPEETPASPEERDPTTTVTPQQLLEKYATMVPLTSTYASLDEAGLAGELASAYRGDAAFIQDLFGLLWADDKDDVSYHFCLSLDDAALGALDHGVLAMMKGHLEGGVSMPSEREQAARIGAILSPEQAPTEPDDPAPDGPGGGAVAAGNDIRVCRDGDARLRDADGNELDPRQVVPRGAYVAVLEERQIAGVLRARVAQLDSSTARTGTELGWTNSSNLRALVRPPRPSSPGTQMAALLSQAQSGHGAMQGKCYRFVKHYIKDCGGYGDILDVYNDERFEGYQVSAIHFADAVRAHGAAAMGLQELSCGPWEAPPGSILVVIGNGKFSMSETHGDISVIEGVSDGVIICYNDGRMRLDARPETWGPGGRYEGALIAIYQPIARS